MALDSEEPLSKDIFLPGFTKCRNVAGSDDLSVLLSSAFTISRTILYSLNHVALLSRRITPKFITQSSYSYDDIDHKAS